ncbi:MAG: hypothetical protein DMG72_03100 [Acidobacteria bacterium]|nr:MAG: hypothetical protein DMG72_03100 [Acidobacteriota bacterium]
MHSPKHPGANFLHGFALAVIALVLLPACSINVKKNEDGEDKKVDIETPVGGIHVSKDADVRDVGLAVYPGARKKQKDSSGDEKSANVNISGPGFGVKVVAVEYLSDDSPDKLIAYYRDQLKEYGSVLECHTSKHGSDVEVNKMSHPDRKESKKLTCDNDDSGKTVELKVGTEDNQHIVAVEPQGKGSSFALVYVQTHGKEGMI